MSLWDGPEAITRFAGRDPGQTVFYPEDDAYLVERDEHVDHYEVVRHESRDLTTARPRNVIQRLLDRAHVWWRRLWPAADMASGDAAPRVAAERWTLIGLR